LQLGLGVALHAKSPEIPQDELQEIVEEAHQICPYSNATRGNINVELSAEGA
jgi:osmotically inducible protein OsmC